MLAPEGLWAALPDRLERLAADAAFDRLDAWSSDDRSVGAYLVDRGVAVIELTGILTKEGSWFGSSTRETAALVTAAARDPEIHAIVIKVSSPGGSTEMLPELAEAIAAADESKPTYGYIEDVGASGGYWPVSQARRLCANRGAIVGSIGAYAVLADTSAAAEKQGVKIHVVKSGEHKGAGLPGTNITEDQLAESQKLVDDIHDRFVRAVASGRRLSLAKVRAMADGRVHTAPEAQAMGLIDEVRGFEGLIASLTRKKTNPSKSTSPTGARAMSTETPESAAICAATLQELKAELPGADAAFLIGQLETAATLAQASKAWINELGARAMSADEAKIAAEAKVAELEKQRPVKPGVEALPGGVAAEATSHSGPAAIQAWNQLVDAQIKAYDATGTTIASPIAGLPRRLRAQVECAAAHPAAHQAFLEATNAAFTKRFGPRYAMRLNDAVAIVGAGA